MGMPVIWLACTSCQLVYQPDPSAFESGATGCPRCGGWTWIAQLGSPDPTTPEKGHAARCGRKAAGVATYDARWDKPWPVLTASPRPAVGGC